MIFDLPAPIEVLWPQAANSLSHIRINLPPIGGQTDKPGESTHPYGSFINPNGSMNQALRHVIFKQSFRMMIVVDAQGFEL